MRRAHRAEAHVQRPRRGRHLPTSPGARTVITLGATEAPHPRPRAAHVRVPPLRRTGPVEIVDRLVTQPAPAVGVHRGGARVEGVDAEFGQNVGAVVEDFTLRGLEPNSPRQRLSREPPAVLDTSLAFSSFAFAHSGLLDGLVVGR